jgi:hypothetical protein
MEFVCQTAHWEVRIATGELNYVIVESSTLKIVDTT